MGHVLEKTQADDRRTNKRISSLWSIAASDNTSNSVRIYGKVNQQQLTNRKIGKAVKHLFIFVLVFLICWLPFSVLLFTTYLVGEIYDNYWDEVALMFLYSNSCINPLLYASMSCRYRESIKEIFKSFRKDNWYVRLSISHVTEYTRIMSSVINYYEVFFSCLYDKTVITLLILLQIGAKKEKNPLSI